MTRSTQLAEFATTVPWSDVPPGTREFVRNLFVDAIACSLAGRRAAARAGFADVARGFGGGLSPVIGDTRPAGRAAAALINSWQTTATTMCDVYRPRMCHVSPPLLGSALAVGAPTGSVTDVIHAFGVGAEITVRVSESLSEEAYRGALWHAPGVVGPFGSATTAALLSGGDADTLERAWGLALLQSAGTFAAIGSAGVKFTQSRAALAGVLAWDMAAAGLGGQLDPFEHPDGGLLIAYGGSDADALVRELGTQWRLDGIALRRWPAASSLQSVVEAVLALRGSAPAIESITVELPAQSFALCADKGWPDQLTALQSARWVAATTWIHGDCEIAQFSPDALTDPVTARFADKVRVVQDERLGDGAARLRVGNGAPLHIAAALGTPERPLTRADVDEKLARAAGAERATRVLRAVADDDFAALISALTS